MARKARDGEAVAQTVTTDTLETPKGCSTALCFCAPIGGGQNAANLTATRPVVVVDLALGLPYFRGSTLCSGGRVDYLGLARHYGEWRSRKSERKCKDSGISIQEFALDIMYYYAANFLERSRPFQNISDKVSCGRDMSGRLAGEAVRFGEELGLPSDLGESRQLLSTLYKSATVGVAIYDRQLRFRGINRALASMNGLPQDAHIGKTIHAVLGETASRIRPALEHVFTTGEPLWNHEIMGKLPERRAAGYWSAHYFPFTDRSGVVQHVGAIVLELPRKELLKDALFELTNDLALLGARIRSTLKQSRFNGRKPRGSASNFLGVLQNCLRNVRLLSDLLISGAPPQIRHPGAGRSPAQRYQGHFVSVVTAEGAPGLIDPLSSREREVIALLASGKSNRDISHLLSISTRTVETHRAKIMLKLNLHSLSDLVLYAVRHRLVEVEA